AHPGAHSRGPRGHVQLEHHPGRGHGGRPGGGGLPPAGEPATHHQTRRPGHRRGAAPPRRGLPAGRRRSRPAGEPARVRRPAAPGTCTLESVTLTTGRPAPTVELPAGRVPVSGDLASPVFSPDGTLAAFQLTRARPDPRFAAAAPSPPSDVAVLHLRTGRLDIMPGLELPPITWAGLAFDTTGNRLLATVSDGDRGELLAWRPGMPGPALMTSLPGPLLEAPPLLAAPSWWRTG